MPLFLANEDLLLPERYVRKGETFRAEHAPRGCINLETNEIVGGSGKSREIFGAPEPGWFEE